tara:strand:- start:10676 stop:10822 length:147 start_codon:yes stop_codon:yes gene_type:complete
MIEVHRDRIDKLFLNFDKNRDTKLSKQESLVVRRDIKKRIYKLNNPGA